MTRRNADGKKKGSFLRKLAWTVVLALVFSAGLIAGQRLMRRDRVEPLVSVTHGPAPTASTDDSEAAAATRQASSSFFSFYERLSEGSTPEDAAGEAGGAAHAPGTEDGSESAGSEMNADRKGPAKYTLQVSAHPEMAAAKAEMKKLRQMGLDPHVVMAKIPEKGKYYRVRLGKFRTMEAAQRFKENVAEKRGVKTFLSPL